jgi:hypothetical protein
MRFASKWVQTSTQAQPDEARALQSSAVLLTRVQVPPGFRGSWCQL